MSLSEGRKLERLRLAEMTASMGAPAHQEYVLTVCKWHRKPPVTVGHAVLERAVEGWTDSEVAFTIVHAPFLRGGLNATVITFS